MNYMLFNDVHDEHIQNHDDEVIILENDHYFP